MKPFAAFFNVYLIGLALGLVQPTPRFRFTKIECISEVKECVEFDYCYLKAVNRNFRYISLKTDIHKFPVENVSVNVAVLKRENGWRPFLYNYTFDACKFLRERQNPLYNFMFKAIQYRTNIPQHCPVHHNVHVEKLSDSDIENSLAKLPVPPGEYAVWTSWYSLKVLKARVNGYGVLT